MADRGEVQTLRQQLADALAEVSRLRAAPARTPRSARAGDDLSEEGMDEITPAKAQRLDALSPQVSASGAKLAAAGNFGPRSGSRGNGLHGSPGSSGSMGAVAASAAAGSGGGATTSGGPAGASDVAYLRLQLDAMRALLPILSIPSYAFSLVPGGEPKEVATYEVMVNYVDSAYAVYRRYSEFRALHDRLEKEFGKEELLPRFPGRKGLFGSTNVDKDAIERRRRELELYIRQLVASDTIRKSTAVTEFFAQLRLDADGGQLYGGAGGDSMSLPGADSEAGDT